MSVSSIASSGQALAPAENDLALAPGVAARHPDETDFKEQGPVFG
jgi:hypothetical protein